MRVIICEDERCFQEALCNAIEEWKEATNHQDVSCICFDSSEDLLASWEGGLSAELLFLDIQIPGELSGMALAKKIRQHDQTVSIVFVTNYADYVYEGYVVNALRYLKKPICREDIYDCMEIAYRHFSLLSKDKISVLCRDRRLVLPFSDIIYVEIRSHYLCLTLQQSGEKPGSARQTARLCCTTASAAFLPMSPKLYCQFGPHPPIHTRQLNAVQSRYSPYFPNLCRGIQEKI